MRKLVFVAVFFMFLVGFAFAGEFNDKLDSSLINEVRENYEARAVLVLNNQSNYYGIVDEGEMYSFLENDSIEMVYLDYLVKAGMADSIPLIGGEESKLLQIGGINITGLDQSVCIVDTGINYKHPDLGGCFGQDCKVVAGYDFVNGDGDPMDDHGHGTHIAGIISSNGPVKGVAPESRIVSMKVLDFDGKGYSSNVIRGIELCINWSDRFNISVIVLSLSTDCSKNPSSCSKEKCVFSSFDNSISKAVEKNISVVAATGNQGMQNLIPSPACVNGVIAAAASTKDDSFLQISNRNSAVKLIAPGENINSLYLDGYATMTGTSIASGHVAGSALVLQQFFAFQSGKKNSFEMEEILRITGKTVTDEVSHLNFSRIDIYNALLYFDDASPKILFNEPKHLLSVLKNEQNFSCSIQDWNIHETSFYLFKMFENEGIEVYNYSIRSEGKYLDLNVSIENLSFGEYYGLCKARDKNGNYGVSNKHFLRVTNLSSVLISPFDNSSIGNESAFSCLAESSLNIDDLQRLNFFIWNDSEQIYNYSLNISGAENITYFRYKFSYEGRYYWNCFVEGSKNLVYYPVNYSVQVNFSIVENLSAFVATYQVAPESSHGGGGGGIILNDYNSGNETNVSLGEEVYVAFLPADNGDYEESVEQNNYQSITGAVVGAGSSEVNLTLLAVIFLAIATVLFFHLKVYKFFMH